MKKSRRSKNAEMRVTDTMLSKPEKQQITKVDHTRKTVKGNEDITDDQSSKVKSHDQNMPDNTKQTQQSQKIYDELHGAGSVSGPKKKKIVMIKAPKSDEGQGWNSEPPLVHQKEPSNSIPTQT